MQKQGPRLLAFAILWIVSQSVAAAMGWKVEAAAHACPFCSAVSQTFSEEIDTMDVAVIAKLVKVPPASDEAGRRDRRRRRLKSLRSSRAKGSSKRARRSRRSISATAPPGKSFLVMGIDPPKVMWSTPLPLTGPGIKYLTSILKLPKDGADRLVFFQKHLEDEDEMLARDAYDEFARAPYAQVKELKDKLNHDQIRGLDQEPGDSRQPAAAVSRDARHLRRREERLCRCWRSS